MLASIRRPLARLVLEQLEDRLTPSWGSIPPATIAPPVNFTSVTLNSSGDAIGNAGILTTEIDWYRFVAPRSGSYLFEATTPTSNLDTVAATYTAPGVRVGYNDDISDTNRDSRFTVNLTSGASYYFGVSNYTGTPGGTYTWRIDGPSASSSDDSYENNDTRATAYNFGTLTAQQSWNNLVMADSQDWYRFTMNSPGTSANFVRINFLNSQGNLNLRLFNNSGVQLASSAGTGDSENISLSGRAAGTYYVQVFGNNGALNPSYSLTINPGQPSTPPPPSSGGFQITLRMTGMSASQQAIFQQAANRWAQVIVGDLPDAVYNGITVDDVLIDASAVAMDGRGGILGSAGPDRLRSGSLLPYHGTMRFDTADLGALEASGGLIYTIMHEMGHVLGIGTIWSQKGLLVGGGTTNPRFIGAQATAQYNAIFGLNATAVPVENTGGSGTRDGHWRESVFDKELMTGWLDSGVNPLSRITVGAMADFGYTVNMAAADTFLPPGGSGGGLSGGGGSGGGAALRASETLKRFPYLNLAREDFHERFTGIGTPLIDASTETAPVPVMPPASPSTPTMPEQTGPAEKLAKVRRTTDAVLAKYDRLQSMANSLV